MGGFRTGRGDAVPENVMMAKDTSEEIYDDATVQDPMYWSADYPVPFIAWKPVEKL
jgi:hypothetical protein